MGKVNRQHGLQMRELNRELQAVITVDAWHLQRGRAFPGHLGYVKPPKHSRDYPGVDPVLVAAERTVQALSARITGSLAIKWGEPDHHWSD